MSSSPEQTFPERPWTPGPWRYERMGYDDAGNEIWSLGSESEPVADHDGMAEPNPSNRALIALAPEMAEAILRYNFCDCENSQAGGVCQTADQMLYDLADKLRKIGAPDA